MKPYTLLLPLFASIAFADVAAGDIRASLVTDANAQPVAKDSRADGFYTHGNKVYFSAWRSDVGKELFATDGSSAEAQLVADLVPGGTSSNVYVLGSIGEKLIVSIQLLSTSVSVSAYPHQVLALDLATGQTAQLAQFAAQDNIYTWRIDKVAEFAGHVAFTDLTRGTVWVTDGSVAGTWQVFQPEQPDDSVSIRTACSLPDRMMFMGQGGASKEIWVSDGTPQGSQVVARVNEPGMPVSAGTRSDGCYFLAQRNTGWSLWLSNGTAGGTGLLRQSGESGAGTLAMIGDVAYLIEHPSSGLRLLRSDQVQAVVDVNRTGMGDDLVAAGSRLAFFLRQPDGAVGIQISDGTTAGTRAATLNGAPLAMASFDQRLVAAGGRFFARDAENVYAIDPATASAVHLGNKILFEKYTGTASLGPLAIGVGREGLSGNEPWRSDGTPQGTRLLHDIAQVTADGVMASRWSVVKGETVFFGNTFNTPNGQRTGLWRTDGSAAGTQALPTQAYEGDSLVGLAELGDGVAFTTARWQGNTAPLIRAYRTGADFAATSLLWQPLVSGELSATGDGAGIAFFCASASAAENLCGLRAGDLQASVLSLGGAAAYERPPAPVGSVGGVALQFYRGRLWRSDGSMPGTFELQPGTEFPRLQGGRSQLLGGRLLFDACTGAQGYDCGLYSSDGSVAGTQRIAEVAGLVYAYAPLGNRVLINISDGAGQLWISDGSSAGTQWIANDVGVANSMTSTGERVHLIGLSEQPLRYDYVVSDGTSAGTRVVPMPAGYGLAAPNPVALDEDTVLFGCFAEQSGVELCSVDAQGDNLRVVADIAPGQTSSDVAFIARMARAAYYSANDGRHGYELWRVQTFADALFADGFD